MFNLSDVFIGEHPIVERFGQNSATYLARYNIQGYPGVRVSMPSLTPILSGADGFVLETGFEEAGKGKYIVIVHDGFLTAYGHMNDITVQKGERVLAGQLIGHSNQSGLTEIPCLYFGVAPCDNAGNKTEKNGYGGFIDPLSDRIKWDIKNPTAPVDKSEILDKMTLTSKEYSILNAQATNYKIIMSFLKQTSFDDFVKESGRVPVNLDVTPDDNTGGESVTLYLRGMAEHFDEMDREIYKLTEKGKEALQEKEIQTEQVSPPEKPASNKKPNFLVRLGNAIKDFIFVD